MSEWKPPQTPLLAVDAIIVPKHGNDRIVLIERKYPPLGYALPGGFTEVGETVENAVIREVKEETNLDVLISCLLGVYSDPDRDPRAHIVSVAYVVRTQNGDVLAGDDAARASWFSLDEVFQMFADDIIVKCHHDILMNYKHMMEART